MTIIQMMKGISVAGGKQFQYRSVILQEAKQERNRQMEVPGSSLSVSDVFVYIKVCPGFQFQEILT